MTDKYQALRGTLDRINGEDTYDCFEAYIFWKRTFDVDDCKALLAERDALRDALLDMQAGWRYIRDTHGDLYGVGWDRAQAKAEAALAKDRGEEL